MVIVIRHFSVLSRILVGFTMLLPFLCTADEDQRSDSSIILAENPTSFAMNGANKDRKYSPGTDVRTVLVSTVNELKVAIKNAVAGDVILVAPGVYRIKQKNISINNPGLANKPVTVMARRLGDVSIEFDSREGFYVAAPNWVFQNLQIQGVCSKHSSCDHAFHIVGAGNNFVLRNNIIFDFNSAIKANGSLLNGGVSYPDKGLIENNTFYNQKIRETGNPVTVLDMVAVSRWKVQDNVITDFVKGRGNGISYAAFFKGNGSKNIFERNLVICTQALSPVTGARVGLSFGGGGTGARYCRNGDCPVEHDSGIVRHNIIAHCDDVGIYLNKSANTQVYNNTLIDTLGIDVRFAQSSAVLTNNIVTGRIKERNDGTMRLDNNLVADSVGRLRRIFIDAPGLDFSLKDTFSIIDRGRNLQQTEKDFCGKSRGPKRVDMGAIEYNQDGSFCSAAKRPLLIKN